MGRFSCGSHGALYLGFVEDGLVYSLVENL
jgi:hypothetical protein